MFCPKMSQLQLCAYCFVGQVQLDKYTVGIVDDSGAGVSCEIDSSTKYFTQCEIQSLEAEHILWRLLCYGQVKQSRFYVEIYCGTADKRF